MVALLKENISLEFTYSFRVLVHYFHGGVQADIMLENKMRVILLDPQATGAAVPLAWLEHI